MALSIINISGKVKLNRNANRVRTAGDEYEYVETLTLTDPTGFTGRLSERAPHKVFLKNRRDHSFVRIATLQDMFTYPDWPEVDVDYYRDDSVEKRFTIPTDGPAFARYVLETVNTLYVQYKDFEAAYSSVSEETWLPDISSSLLYELIQQYIQAKDDADTLKQQIAVAQGKYDTLNEVYSTSEAYEDAVSPADIQAIIVSLPKTLTLAQTTLEAARGVGSPVSLSTIRQTLLNSSEPTIGRLDTSLSVANKISTSDLVTLDAIIQYNVLHEGWSWSGDTGYEESDYNAALHAASTGATNIQQMLAPTITALNSVVDQLATLDGNIQTLADRMDAASTAVTNGASGMKTAMMIKGVSIDKIEKLKVTILKNINSLKTKYDDALALKQSLISKIQEIAPDVDPSDPMKIYNYRVFKLTGTSV